MFAFFKEKTILDSQTQKIYQEIDDILQLEIPEISKTQSKIKNKIIMLVNTTFFLKPKQKLSQKIQTEIKNTIKNIENIKDFFQVLKYIDKFITQNNINKNLHINLNKDISFNLNKNEYKNIIIKLYQCKLQNINIHCDNILEKITQEDTKWTKQKIRKYGIEFFGDGDLEKTLLDLIKQNESIWVVELIASNGLLEFKNIDNILYQLILQDKCTEDTGIVLSWINDFLYKEGEILFKNKKLDKVLSALLNIRENIMIDHYIEDLCKNNKKEIDKDKLRNLITKQDWDQIRQLIYQNE